MIVISLNGKVIGIIFTTLSKDVLIENWYVVKKMANTEDLVVL
jgi:hypothetical protein